MTRAESIAILKELQGAADYYARDTDAHVGSPMQASPVKLELGSWTAIAASLSFDGGSGQKVADGTYSWKTWAGQLENLVSGMVDWRNLQGYPQFSNEDPLVTWWTENASKQLATISVGEFIETATEPLRQVGSAAAGVLEYGEGVVIAIVVILVLIIVVKVT